MKHLHVALPKDIFALLTNRVLFRFGFGLVGVFVPIFLYETLGGSLYLLLSIYIAFYIISVLTIPLGAMLLDSLGIRKLLIMAVPFAALSIGSLYYAQEYAAIAIFGYFFSAIMYRVLYWVPYQVDFSHFIGRKHAGASMAFYRNALQVMNAITPVAGGIFITSFGFGVVFIFSALVLLTTIIPTLFIRTIHERYQWSFKESFTQLFAYKNRSLLYAYIADGAQSVITSVIWPIFIFELFNGNYASVGFVTSLTVIVILFLNTAVGKFIDHVGEEKALTYSTIFASTGWFMKIFVDSAFQVFVADTYHRLGRAANRMSFDTATNEHAADNGHYIDEFTTLKEMALNIGRATMLIAVCILFYYFENIRIVFIIAAGATLAMSILNKQMGVK